MRLQARLNAEEMDKINNSQENLDRAKQLADYGSNSWFNLAK